MKQRTRFSDLIDRALRNTKGRNVVSKRSQIMALAAKMCDMCKQECDPPTLTPFGTFVHGAMPCQAAVLFEVQRCEAEMGSRDALLALISSKEISNAISGAVRQTLSAHSATEPCFVSSATKRIIGALKMLAKRNH